MTGISPRKRALLEALRQEKGLEPKLDHKIPPRQGTGPAPLSFAQQRLWFLDQLEPGQTSYNVVGAFTFTGPLDRRALQESLNLLVQRHEVLRTTFSTIDGQPVQVIASDSPVEMPVIDLSDSGSSQNFAASGHAQQATSDQVWTESQLAEVERRAKLEAGRPLDLARGPLLRVSLLALAPEQHVLLLSMHHIVSDGWSLGIFWEELSTAYSALTQHLNPRLPELPIQYADFAAWQRQWLHEGSALLQDQLAYWKEQLQGAPELLSLPTDRPRPAILSYKGSAHYFSLPAELGERLNRLSRQEKVSLFMLLLAAWQVLLIRLSGQQDVVVATPVAYRTRAETASIIGFFVNTLPIRLNLKQFTKGLRSDGGDAEGDAGGGGTEGRHDVAGPTFREVLQEVRECVLQAFAHEDVPFERFVEELRPRRDLSHSPLFQVMFQLRHVAKQRTGPAESLPQMRSKDWQPTYSEESIFGEELEGWHRLVVQPLRIDYGIANFDLSLQLVASSGSLTGSLIYSTDLFDATTAEKITKYYQCLLEGIVEEPACGVWRLPLLGEDERNQLLFDWNDTAQSHRTHLCVHQLVAEQAKRTCDAVAVEGDHSGGSLTYLQLEQRANQLGHYLRKIGVGPDVVVAICTERSPELVVASLGVLKAGGAYLPLDPSYPQERFDFMLRDSRAVALITLARMEPQLQGVLDRYSGRVLYLDALDETLSNSNSDEPHSGVRPANLAYVIYTSGSTGNPKGVAMPHSAVVNLIELHLMNPRLQVPSRTLQFASLGFDVAFQEIFSTLASGGTLVLPREEVRHDIDELLSTIISKKIDRLFLPVVILDALALTVSAGKYPLALKDVITAGEQLRISKHVADMFRRIGTCTLHNHYGPTETHVVSTYELQSEGVSDWPDLPPIGRPIMNSRLYVLDTLRQSVPIGVVGELYIGGAGMARGYLNQPGLTAEKFTANPFSEGTGERLYRSGDLARYLANGNLEFMGRYDEQVKIRGYRVELGEIKVALDQHPWVKESVVQVREHGPDEKRIVAYVVPSKRSLTSAELNNFLRQKLPSYMIPSACIFLEALPTTPNGKVNRDALPLQAQSTPEMQPGYVAPRTIAEQILADIWSDVLHLERIGTHDNFFDSGGHSLMVIQMVAKARQKGLPVRPAQVFQNQTIAELQSVIDKAIVTEAEQGAVTGPVPLMPMQHWFFEPNYSDPHLLSESRLLEVPVNFEPALLEQVIKPWIAHHDALRLRFKRETDGWHQFNAAEEEHEVFSAVDLSTLAEEEQLPAIRVCAREACASVNLAVGPLLQIVYFNRGPNKSGRLLLIIHHLSLDGYSWEILLEDLEAAYVQLSHGETLRFPPKSTSFKYWAERLAAYAKSSQLRQEMDYWSALADVQVKPWPVDYPWAFSNDKQTQVVPVSLSASETQFLISNVQRSTGAQTRDLLLSTLALALQAHTGTLSLMVRVSTHGREPLFEEVDLSRTVGWLSTFFPVWLDLEQAISLEEMITLTREQLRQVPNGGIGYNVLRRMSGDTGVAQTLRDINRKIGVTLNFIGESNRLISRSNLFLRSTDTVDLEHNLMRTVDIRVIAGVVGGTGRLQLNWQFDANYYQRATIERLAHRQLSALQTLISRYDSYINPTDH